MLILSCDGAHDWRMACLEERTDVLNSALDAAVRKGAQMEAKPGKDE